MKNNAWTHFIKNQSIRFRFFTTLLVNIAKVLLGFISGIVIARSLGPEEFGNYSFLLGSFGSITGLIDIGTSSAFYTFLSQRRRSLKFYLYYFLWITIQFIIVLALISFIFPEAWRNKIWLGHQKGIIMLAFVASFMMNKVWQIMLHAGESIRATIIVQLHDIAIMCLYLCVVVVMVFARHLTVSNLFITIGFLYLFLSFLLSKKLKGDLIARDEDTRLKDVFNEFKNYCTPLIMYGIVGFFYSFTSIWLLQRFGGAAQQAFYSVGLRFSAVCLIATTSILKVFWKEIAEANASGNKERLHYLYTKTSRVLYFISAAGACFLIPFSRNILVLLLGPKYEAGWVCMAIMFFYPVHQSLGQINGSFFYATARTRLYSKLSIIVMLISIPVTYFILASHSAIIPGLGLGSVGLALKMVIFQIISVNLLAYFIARFSKWRFDFFYQFKILSILLAASFLVKFFIKTVFGISGGFSNPLIVIILSVPLYIFLVAVVIYLLPGLAGLHRKEIARFSGFFIRKFSKK